ncbi:CLUMA_CG004868, isoform A [Clunio marinus]|uniref:CLUMA_CG004868, isoform A n=1 Tax=Clunio marinus TaxID=568069 RepID=A0A1J1HSZ1_9DIPT|nr:CLUMA_CG004868, isoform A [Clunio marinus]
MNNLAKPEYLKVFMSLMLCTDNTLFETLFFVPDEVVLEIKCSKSSHKQKPATYIGTKLIKVHLIFTPVHSREVEKVNTRETH